VVSAGTIRISLLKTYFVLLKRQSWQVLYGKFIAQYIQTSKKIERVGDIHPASAGIQKEFLVALRFDQTALVEQAHIDFSTQLADGFASHDFRQSESITRNNHHAVALETPVSVCRLLCRKTQGVLSRAWA
jgi:hypothetical protein